jgi:hypothetical protein
MAKFMHQEVMKATRARVGVARYVALNCDEMSTVDNQSWLSIHRYVVQNWVRISILVSLDKMLEGLGSDNLVKVIMEAFTIGGGTTTKGVPICQVISLDFE